MDWLTSIPQHYWWWLGAFSVLMFVGTLAAIPVIVARMRADYFIREESPASWMGRHPALRILGHVLKNLLGGVLVLLGIVMSLPLVPGQGLLTILIGLMLLEFPGKRRLESWFVRRRSVSSAIQWMRKKAGRPPLQIPPEPETGQKKQPGE